MKAILVSWGLEYDDSGEDLSRYGSGPRAFTPPVLFRCSCEILCDGEAAERFQEFMRVAMGVDVPQPNEHGLDHHVRGELTGRTIPEAEDA